MSTTPLHETTVESNLPRTEDNDVASIHSDISETLFYDPLDMAPLNPRSLAALARLRAYKPPPFTIWEHLPLSRRAAVLILLFADKRGDLRVVLTMRASTLRNYSGQAAFPGGKADTLSESPFEIARREAWEEVGLPQRDTKLPKHFRIEHLAELPFSLAKTALAVRPCVAFLHVDSTEASVEENMIPRLDAKEVAAVFSAPFHNFLLSKDEDPITSSASEGVGEWYSGTWIDWHEGKWRLHNFYVPISNQKVAKPKRRENGQAAIAEELEKEEDELGRYRVWGMTARILVDAAKTAYDEVPDFEHLRHVGDEVMIKNLFEDGRLGEKVPGGPDLTDGDLKRARQQQIRESESKI